MPSARNIRHILLATALAWTPTAAVAETVPLTFAKALEIAERQNPDIQAALERAQAETLRVEAVKRMAWPRLSLATGWSHTNLPAMVFAQKLNAGEFTEEDFAIDRLNSPDALSHLMTTVSLEVPIDIFGKVSARVEGQTAVGAAADAATREAVQQLRLHVVQAYRQAALARRARGRDGACPGQRPREGGRHRGPGRGRRGATRRSASGSRPPP